MSSLSRECIHSQDHYQQLYACVDKGSPSIIHMPNSYVGDNSNHKVNLTNIQMSASLFFTERVELLKGVANLGCINCASDLTTRAITWLKDAEATLTERAILYLVTAYKIQKKRSSNTDEIEKKLQDAFKLCKPQSGNNLLHHFIECQYSPVIEFLLECEKEKVTDWLRKKNGKGLLPIHTAAIVGNSEVMELLLKACTTDLLNKGDSDGDNPLDLTYLLNQRDIDGNTPLDLAVVRTKMFKEKEEEFALVIKLLLEHGANPEVKNQAGEHPLDFVPESEKSKKILFDSGQFCFWDLKKKMIDFYQNNDSQIKRHFENVLDLKIHESFTDLSIVREEAQKSKETPVLTKLLKSKEIPVLTKLLNRPEFFKDYETVFEANEIDLIIEKNLFEKEVKTKKILIFGQPGIGKKTLCQYLTYQWWGDCGAWKERFDLVVRINLRNLTKEKYRDRNISLEEIIVCEYFHSTKQKNHQEMEHIRKALHCTPNKKKLFLFVGYDELLDNSPCKTTIDNFLFKEKKFYEENNFYFILTSRPNALIRSENFDFHLRCIGFGSEKIPAYLKTQNVCANSETAQKIVGFLKEREEIHNLAHIPTLLDSLAVTKQKIFASEPDKIRKLYECIVNKLWERHQSKLRELNFSDEDINKRQEQAEKLLKALAFDSLLRKKIVFSHKFVKKVARNTFNCRDLEAASKVKDLMSPGFLNCYRRSPHEENKYLFLHLTIQEYLANLYISDWSSKNAKIDIYNPSTKKKAQSTAEEFISTYKDNSHFQGVWLFC